MATVSIAAPANSLQGFVQNVQNAQGEFTQVKLNEQGQPSTAVQTGSFLFKRPGLFKWHIQSPYEQLTVSDGKKLYQYDPDLSQAIVRNVDESLGASPAAILFGDGNLHDSFNIVDRPQKNGLQWLRAEPLSADAGFSYIDIGFKSDLPAQLLLNDSFGQITRIELLNLSTNTEIDASEFTFTPPPGVDVVNM